MANKELKTKANERSVEDFLGAVENRERRDDGHKLLEIFTRLTGEKAKMWGPSIVGFGNHRYKYPDGREMDWMVTAFSPRKQSLTLYVICDSPKQPALLAKLGKHTTSVSCLYIKRLSDIDVTVLEAVITDAYTHVLTSSKN